MMRLSIYEKYEFIKTSCSGEMSLPNDQKLITLIPLLYQNYFYFAISQNPVDHVRGGPQIVSIFQYMIQITLSTTGYCLQVTVSGS